MPFLASPRALRLAGVLGINRRNTELTLPLNVRARYPLVDDKVITKALCREHGIPVPDTYAVVDRFGTVKHVGDLVADRSEFVIKPARGAGGRGVLVIAEHDGDRFVKSTGEVLSLAEVRYHVASTLQGLYSLGGLPDRAIIEYRVRPHPTFQPLSMGGTPDARIIVHRGEPLMAMLRMPTLSSGGCANLHQGGVGVGIHLDTGRTTYAVWKDRAVERHPDSGAGLCGVAVPNWGEQLAIASRLARTLDLGYIGIDLVLDPERGPLVLEANARPGLAIQIANRTGLLSVLERKNDRDSLQQKPEEHPRRRIITIPTPDVAAAAFRHGP